MLWVRGDEEGSETQAASDAGTSSTRETLFWTYLRWRLELGAGPKAASPATPRLARDATDPIPNFPSVW